MRRLSVKLPAHRKMIFQKVEFWTIVLGHTSCTTHTIWCLHHAPLSILYPVRPCTAVIFLPKLAWWQSTAELGKRLQTRFLRRWRKTSRAAVRRRARSLSQTRVICSLKMATLPREISWLTERNCRFQRQRDLAKQSGNAWSTHPL